MRHECLRVFGRPRTLGGEIAGSQVRTKVSPCVIQIELPFMRGVLQTKSPP